METRASRYYREPFKGFQGHPGGPTVPPDIQYNGGCDLLQLGWGGGKERVRPGRICIHNDGEGGVILH